MFNSVKQAKASASAVSAAAVPEATSDPLDLGDTENQFIAIGDVKPGADGLKRRRHSKRNMMMIVSTHQTQRLDVPVDVARIQSTDAPMDIPKARVAVPIPPFPFPLPPRARPCINAVLASYGPAVLALLAGILFLSFITCVVGILLFVRYWMKTEEEEVQAYDPLLIKEEVLVVPRDYTASRYHD